MPITARPIIGLGRQPDAALPAFSTLSLTLTEPDFTPSYLIVPRTVVITWDEDGEVVPADGYRGVTVEVGGIERPVVWSSEEGERQATYRLSLRAPEATFDLGTVTIPEGTAPLTVQQIIELGITESDPQFLTILTYLAGLWRSDWDEQDSYARGSLVRRQGNVYIATEDIEAPSPDPVAGGPWDFYVGLFDLPLAEALIEQAEDARDAAVVAQGLAEGARDDAQTAQGLAEGARDSAKAARDDAQDARDAAQTAQGLAEGARDDAVTAQGLAESAQSGAETAQGLSEAARDDAVTAQGLAETARDDAQTAQGLAEGARDDAVTAQGLAEAARDDAETARDDAQAAQGNAETAQSGAEAARDDAEDARDAAVVAQGLSEDARDDAQTAQGLAESAQSSAEAARDDAQAAQGLAEDARDDAQTAQGEAEAARDAAVSAQGDAEDARDAAVVAQGLAEGARDDAETARDDAQTAQGLAESAKDDAETARDDAQAARDDAQTAQGLAEGARDDAQAAQGLAEDARDAAVVAQGLAETAQSDAETARDDAQTAQGLAEGARDDAVTAQGLAETARDDAESARDDAQTAQGLAESAQSSAEAARDDAQTAQGLAEGARDDAVTAQGLAESARDDAETARDDAQTAQGLAEAARDDAQTAQTGAETARDEAEAARDQAQELSDRIPDATGEPAGLTLQTDGDDEFLLTDTPSARRLDFDTADPEQLDADGQVAWADQDRALAYYVDGLTVRVGQEVVVLVRNTGATIPKGTPVCITGVSANRIEVEPSSAAPGGQGCRTLGITRQEIGTNAFGIVSTFGFVKGVDTSGFDVGDELFLGGAPGTLVTTPPESPARRVTVGYVVAAHPTIGSIFVTIRRGVTLAEVDDVHAPDPQDGQVLRYVDAEDRYEVETLGPADVGAYPDDNPDGFVDAAGAASAAPVQSVNGEDGDVTLDAADVGADPAGSADAVQGNLTDHIADDDNPHNTTAAQVGLGDVPNLDTTDAVNKAHDQDTDTALASGTPDEVTAADARAHIDATDNPHGVTAAQAGADPAGSADAVASDLTDHIADDTNPHQVTKEQVGLGDVPNLDTSPLFPVDEHHNVSADSLAIGGDNGTLGGSCTAVGVGAEASPGNVTAMGRQAAENNNGSFVTALGRSAAINNTSVNVTAVGHRAAQNNTGARVTATGREAARDNTGRDVTATGFLAAQDNTGDFVTATGREAALGNTGGLVTATGVSAAQNNSGGLVTATGVGAARGNTGDNVTATGRNAAEDNTGDNVTATGRRAAQNNTGDSVTATGFNAANGNTGDRSAFYGFTAGQNNDRNNRLIIDTPPSGDSPNLSTPLIDGRFGSGTDPDNFAYSKGVRVNGLLEAVDGLVLRSPNGTRWLVTVDDSGNLQTTDTGVGEITP